MNKPKITFGTFRIPGGSDPVDQEHDKKTEDASTSGLKPF